VDMPLNVDLRPDSKVKRSQAHEVHGTRCAAGFLTDPDKARNLMDLVTGLSWPVRSKG
jgi:hypothetical protein